MHPTPRLSLAAVATFACGAALAHHPNGGAMPATLVDGLLSGLAHPVIAFDHLLFLLAAAVLAGLAPGPAARPLAALAVFVLAATLGTVLRATGPGLPLLEPLLGASLLVAGVPLWRGRAPAFVPALLVAAGAGVLHGQAYGEAVIGAEATPLAAYLAGLVAVQGALLAAVAIGVRRHARPRSARLALALRGMAGVLSAAGLWLVGSALLA